MMLNVILLVMSSNMDDFGFGLSIGFRSKIQWWAAAIIGLMSGVTMGAGMICGQFTAALLSVERERDLSALIYLIMAVWFALDELRSDNDRSKGPEDHPPRWTPFSALIAGIALGIDSFFLGISAGLMAMPLWFASILAGVSSFLLIFGGAVLARRIAVRLPNLPAGLISAGLLSLLAGMTLR